MASFFRGTVRELLLRSDEQVIANLTIEYAKRGYTTQYSDQTLTWQRDLHSIRSAFEICVASSKSAENWGVLFEFSIPRKESRIDLVLLVRDVVVVIEAKTGAPGAVAKRQIEEYALLLHYFHKPSAKTRVVPIIVSDTVAVEEIVQLKGPFPPVEQVFKTSWGLLSSKLIDLEKCAGNQISVDQWDDGPYYPVPTIFEAAIALRSGLSIRE